MSKNIAFRTFIAAFIAVLGGLAPLAVTGNFTVASAGATIAALLPGTHLGGAQLDSGKGASSIVLVR